MKKATALTLALAMIAIIALSSLPVFAKTEIWDGKSGTALPTGFGTEADPYVIKAPAELDYIATASLGGEKFTGKYFRLDADIDWGGREWTPIGTSDNPFGGIFDGNGKTIFNLKVSASELAAIFNYATDAEIKNLKIDYAEFTTDTRYAGAIVALMRSSKLTNCVGGENVKVTTTSIMSNTAQVGGLVGLVNSSTVESCAFYGKVDVKNVQATSFIGGIAGVIGNESTVKNCINFGSVSAVACNVEGGYGYVGGVAGGIGSSKKIGTLEACVNNGSVQGGEYVGGVIGRVHVDNSVLNNCMNLGDVVGGSDKTGGIIGSAAKTLVSSGNMALNGKGSVVCGDAASNTLGDANLKFASDQVIRTNEYYDNADKAIKALPSFAVVTPSQPVTEAVTTQNEPNDTTSPDADKATTPVVTTKPDETSAKATNPATNQAPQDSAKPSNTTQAEPKDSGCGGFAYTVILAALLSVTAGAFVCIKKH